MPAQTPTADPMPPRFNALSVMETMAETAIARGADMNALKALLAHIRKAKADV